MFAEHVIPARRAVACQPRAYRTTTVRDEDTPPVTDHVGRDFTAPAPGCKLVGDITYVRTWEGWLYLATVIDCHTKAVVGWSMAEHMRTDLICDAIDMAATNVGTRPTFDEKERIVEAFILDYSGNLYDSEITLEFVKRLRDELRFETVEALVSQMHEDVEQTRQALKKYP